MQRSKIKVGVDYALATWRDWEKYRSHVRKVQVLDVGAWEVVPAYRSQTDTKPPEVVPIPHRPARETLEVPLRYRRYETIYGAPRSKGMGNYVLVRQWLPGADNNQGAWGDPVAVETRTLVATWEDAEQRMAAHQQAEAERLAAARAEKSSRKDREGRINERLRDLNLDRQVTLERSRISTGDVSTVTADLLEALLGLAEGRS